MFKFFIPVFLILSLFQCQKIVNVTEDFSLQVSFEDKNITFEARLNGNSTKQGWLCWGLGARMYPADLVCCYKNSTTNLLQCGDYYNDDGLKLETKNFPAPEKDEAIEGTNDVTLLAFNETTDYRMYKVTRPKFTGDRRDFAYTDQTNHLIWAYNNLTDSLNASTKHTSHGFGYYQFGETSNGAFIIQFFKIALLGAILVGLIG